MGVVGRWWVFRCPRGHVRAVAFVEQFVLGRRHIKQSVRGLVLNRRLARTEWRFLLPNSGVSVMVSSGRALRRLSRWLV